jgi:hypothetical protein
VVGRTSAPGSGYGSGATVDVPGSGYDVGSSSFSVAAGVFVSVVVVALHEVNSIEITNNDLKYLKLMNASKYHSNGRIVITKSSSPLDDYQWM